MNEITWWDKPKYRNLLFHSTSAHDSRASEPIWQHFSNRLAWLNSMIQCFNNIILWAGGYSLPSRKKNAEQKIIAIYRWTVISFAWNQPGISHIKKDHPRWPWKHKITLQIITEFFSKRRRIYIIWLYGLGSVFSSLKIWGIGHNLYCVSVIMSCPWHWMRVWEEEGG